MGAAYSQDLRDRVIRARDQGHGTGVVAERFSVSASWVRRVMQRRRESGETKPRKAGGATRVKIDPGRLRELAAAHPDATAAELRDMLGVDCGVSGIGEALRRLGLTYKKRRSTPPSRIGLTSPSDARPGSRTRRHVTPGV